MSNQKLLRYTDSRSDVDWLIMVIVVVTIAVMTSLFLGQPADDQFVADYDSNAATIMVEQSR